MQRVALMAVLNHFALKYNSIALSLGECGDSIVSDEVTESIFLPVNSIFESVRVWRWAGVSVPLSTDSPDVIWGHHCHSSIPCNRVLWSRKTKSIFYITTSSHQLDRTLTPLIEAGLHKVANAENGFQTEKRQALISRRLICIEHWPHHFFILQSCCQ